MNRWVVSLFEHPAHALPADDGDQSPGVLIARCGHQLPSITFVHHNPVGRKCALCDLLLLADEFAPERFGRRPD